jgi:hypothetical protein
MDDLNRAVEVTKMAPDATTPDHRDRTMILNNLGNFLGRLFELVRQMKDLDRAIDVINIAVESTSSNHPDRSRWPNNFGAWLGRRIGREKRWKISTEISTLPIWLCLSPL